MINLQRVEHLIRELEDEVTKLELLEANVDEPSTKSSCFTSVLKLNSVTLPPPVITSSKRQDINSYRQQACVIEARQNARRSRALIAKVQAVLNRIEERKTPSNSPRSDTQANNDLCELSNHDFNFNRTSVSASSVSTIKDVTNSAVPPHEEIHQSANKPSQSELCQDGDDSRQSNRATNSHLRFTETNFSLTYSLTKASDTFPICDHVVTSAEFVDKHFSLADDRPSGGKPIVIKHDMSESCDGAPRLPLEHPDDKHEAGSNKCDSHLASFMSANIVVGKPEFDMVHKSEDALNANTSEDMKHVDSDANSSLPSSAIQHHPQQSLSDEPQNSLETPSTLLRSSSTDLRQYINSSFETVTSTPTVTQKIASAEETNSPNHYDQSSVKRTEPFFAAESAPSKSSVVSSHNHNQVHTAKRRPRLGSYTLDSPSPGLLEAHRRNNDKNHATQQIDASSPSPSKSKQYSPLKSLFSHDYAEQKGKQDHLKRFLNEVSANDNFNNNSLIAFPGLPVYSFSQMPVQSKLGQNDNLITWKSVAENSKVEKDEKASTQQVLDVASLSRDVFVFGSTHSESFTSTLSNPARASYENLPLALLEKQASHFEQLRKQLMDQQQTQLSLLLQKQQQEQERLQMDIQKQENILMESVQRRELHPSSRSSATKQTSSASIHSVVIDNSILEKSHQWNSLAKKFDKLSAAAKGYLTRRLLRTEKVQGIIKMIKDTLDFTINLTSETPMKKGQASLSDQDLQERLLAQLMAALIDLHDIFHVIPVTERMAIISHDRQVLQERHSKERETAKASAEAMRRKSGLSSATVKYMDRKKSQSFSMPRKSGHWTAPSQANVTIRRYSPKKPKLDHNDDRGSQKENFRPTSGTQRLNQTEKLTEKKPVRRSLYKNVPKSSQSTIKEKSGKRGLKPWK